MRRDGGTRPMRAALTGAVCALVALGGALALQSTASPLAAGGKLHAAPYVEKHSEAPELLTEAQCEATDDIAIPCYDPAQLQRAYAVRPLFQKGVTGKGQTIVIVDSFGSPTMAHDLGVFDARFHLPEPPSFKVVAPVGTIPRFDPNTSTMVGWAGETTLDVELAHVMAPGAGIVVVETPVSETEGTVGFPQIVAAEHYVIDHKLGNVISQSFGANEHTFTSPAALLSLRSALVSAAAAGVTVLAASGDTGASDVVTATATTYSTTRAITWPASDPLVTAVGGTQLRLDTAGRRTAPDQAWNDTYTKAVNDFLFATGKAHPDAGGGGLSSIFGRPSYQDAVAGVVGGHRGVPDISMSAACSGLVDTYQSFGGPTPPGWYYVCGTSEAAPLFAGVVALADQQAHHGLGAINPALYAMARAHDPGIVPVTRGDTTVSFDERGRQETVNGYAASGRYNLAAGLGTVDVARFVPELVRTERRVGTRVSYGYLPAPAQQPPAQP